MWNRKDLKARGKAAFKNNYWMSVVAALILSVVIAGVTAYVSVSTGGSAMENVSAAAESIAAGIGGFSVLAFLINIFVCKPLEIGGRWFFLNNSEGRGDINDFKHGFEVNYLNNVLTMFLRDLFITLWSLLLFVPGVVKMYAYSLVPYILAEHPEMSGTEAIQLSEKMMKGHKWNAFVLDLSFMGWTILSVLTFGIVGFFYTNPYASATDAELYKAIKADYEAKTAVA